MESTAAHSSAETIFAFATAAGKAGVAVLRISGPCAQEALLALGFEQLPTPRRAIFHSFTHPEIKEEIDRGLALWFPSPHSFTGEDVAELHLHGSKAVIQEMISALHALPNFRLAEPGEFSRRAFENGKMDLTELEGLADLIEAQTQAQQRQALRQMRGELEELYETWRAQFIDILAQLEAHIDFPDENLPKTLTDQIETKVVTITEHLLRHRNDPRGERIRNGLHVSILGAPNVGKSSLMNFLAKRDIAIVSNIAGTTRDVIEIQLDLHGFPVTIFDTAGMREHADTIETEGIKRAQKTAHNSDIKLIMLDANSGDTLNEMVADLVDENTLILVNKTDLVSDFDIQKFASEFTHFDTKKITFFPISLKMQENVENFLETLTKMIEEKFSATEDPVFTRERHRRHLDDCLTHLERFTAAIKNAQPIELAAEDLRLAARALGQITGKIELEEILDELFAQFCIGK